MARRRGDLSVLDLSVAAGCCSRGHRNPRAARRCPGNWFEPTPPRVDDARRRRWIRRRGRLESAGRTMARVGDARDHRTGPAGTDSMAWTMRAGATASPSWSSRRYRTLGSRAERATGSGDFIAPNQLLESRPDGLSILQAMPTAPGALPATAAGLHLARGRRARRARCSIWRSDFSRCGRRSALRGRRSVQTGHDRIRLSAAGRLPDPAGVAWFRDRLRRAFPLSRCDRAADRFLREFTILPPRATTDLENCA